MYQSWYNITGTGMKITPSRNQVILVKTKPTQLVHSMVNIRVKPSIRIQKYK